MERSLAEVFALSTTFLKVFKVPSGNIITTEMFCFLAYLIVAHVPDLGFVEMAQLVLLGLRAEAQFVN